MTEPTIYYSDEQRQRMRPPPCEVCGGAQEQIWARSGSLAGDRGWVRDLRCLTPDRHSAA